MNSLPSSIESCLLDAGFSGTEIVILQKLLENDSLTLRELAAKTGKSTGVLDQAMSKLLKKKIIHRQMVNDAPRYILQSLQTVLDWIRDDTELRQQMMIRKYQNFEAFLASLQKRKTRPEMEYFEGEEGIRRAYSQLLDRGKVFLSYGPVQSPDIEEELIDVRKHNIRDRKKREIFSRVITQNTPLGRRLQSRDPFEFRHTVLVDPEEYPFAFETIIVGDTVACFQLKDKRACFIHYPELAEEERAFFESVWQKNTVHTQKEPERKEGREVIEMSSPRKKVPMREIVKILLRKRNIGILSGLFVLLCALIPAAYFYTFSVTKAEVGQRLMAIVSTAAKDIRADDLSVLHIASDMQRPEYQRVFNTLNDVRNRNHNILYIFIYRPTDIPNMWEFVVDADSNVNLPFESDVNHDGKIDPSEQNVYPGRSYDMSTQSPKILNEGMIRPVYDTTTYTDQWTTDIAATAPIMDSNGNGVAVLSADISMKELTTLASAHFKPILYGLLGMILLILIAMGVQGWGVLRECSLSNFNSRSRYTPFSRWGEFFFSKGSVAIFGACAGLSLLATYAFYAQNLYFNTQRIREQVKSIAATGAIQFSASDINQVRSKYDIQKPEYTKIIRQLNDIRDQNPDVKFIYIMRPTGDPLKYEFVADADSIDPDKVFDLNRDGILDKADENIAPGRPYDGSLIDVLRDHSYTVPIASSKVFTDQWGTFISGFAPIKGSDGTIVGILGVDKWATDAHNATKNSFSLWVWGIVFFLIFSSLGQIIFNRDILRDLYKSINVRKVMISLGISFLLATSVTYGLYLYTQKLTLQRMQQVVKSVAEAAALQFSADDLNALQVEEDWKKPEWAKVVNQLKQIRDNNKNLVYTYILRKDIKDGTKINFVSEAESINPYVNIDNDPNNNIDENQDGLIDGTPTGGDYLVWPGQQYVNAPPETFQAYAGSTTNREFYEDQFGKVISGYAPIKDIAGKTVAVFAADMHANKLNEIAKNSFMPFYFFLVVFMLSLIIQFTASYRKF